VPAGGGGRHDGDAGREVTEDDAEAVGVERLRHAARSTRPRAQRRRPDADPLVAAVRTIALKIVEADAGTPLHSLSANVLLHSTRDDRAVLAERVVALLRAVVDVRAGRQLDDEPRLLPWSQRRARRRP